MEIFTNNEEKYLLITSCSKAKKKLDNVPAIELYDGPAFKIIRKYKPPNVDVLILSAKYGLIDENTIINYYDMEMSKERAIELKNEVFKKFFQLKLDDYGEIFINLGKIYHIAFEDCLNHLENSTNVIVAQGTIGIRLKTLKEWIVNIGSGSNGSK
ncbi:conserved hypothetical protein [Methanocaldococcus sp. FS406-22]|uniref:DUF6884 domain-containing protein n=1 Tax=Methanocaldococcus sp. (strain FS406-22) TaxID=644281 RepID=UPI0001BF1759|nr:DUF6884 domain-containing protein [Methanocaldococcus sp. FS406-22]ADC69067.1 conserved hypothetical protein [Methanocaldococcus sp. FS406-22]